MKKVLTKLFQKSEILEFDFSYFLKLEGYQKEFK